MKTLTLIFLSALCSIGLIAQEGSGSKKEFKIHGNSRDQNPTRIDKNNMRLELKKENHPTQKLKPEPRNRPHFDKKDKKQMEHKEKRVRERKERKDLHERKGK